MIRRIAVIACLALSACAHEDANAPPPPVAERDPAAIYLAQERVNDFTLFEADRHSLLERITRDYNNDGRPDLALSLLDACGAGSFSTGCEHELYIARADGGYDYAGRLPAHAETATLIALAPGRARLAQCIYRRFPPFSLDTYVITDHGAIAETSTAMSEAELDAACPRNDTFPATMELCDVADYGRTGHCAWRREGE